MWKFSELEYKRPDMAAFKRRMRKLLKVFDSAETYEQQRAAYLEIEKHMSALESTITLSTIRYHMNSKDEFYAKEREFWDEATPKLLPLQKQMLKSVVNMRFKKEAEAEFGKSLFDRAEVQLKLADTRLIPDMIADAKLKSAYNKLISSCSTELDGQKLNFYGLLKRMESTDRAERKAAFEKWAELYESASGGLDGIYDKMIKARVRMARKLGMDFTHFAYLDRGRLDYTPDDVAKFREGIRKYVVPACAKLYEKQRERIGVDKLHWYDEKLFYPDGNPAPIGGEEYLVSAASEMYHELSPETGEFFDFMCEHQLFDLVTRDNKRMGGYCTSLPDKLAPFIFSNFNGTSADVDVLTHEAGHAFQAYLGMRTIPILEQVQAPMEICEVHSMSMEHFTYPWMEKFFGESWQKRNYAHLSDALMSIPYLVAVDEFQHGIYANPDMKRDERYKLWHDIEKTYMPWRDWDGNAFLEKGGFWMQKLHIFLYPFYYIEYALAQTCAFCFYLKMQENREQAWSDYLALCKAGGTLGYKELLGVGKLMDPFDPETLRIITDSIMKQL